MDKPTGRSKDRKRGQRASKTGRKIKRKEEGRNKKKGEKERETVSVKQERRQDR